MGSATISRNVTTDRGMAAVRIRDLQPLIEACEQELVELTHSRNAVRSNIFVAWMMTTYEEFDRSSKRMEAVCTRIGTVQSEKDRYEFEVRALRALHAL